MTSTQAIRLVAGREMRQRIRSKAYLVTTLLTIAIVLALIIVPGLVGDSADEFKIGSVGDGNAEIVANAVLFATAEEYLGTLPSGNLTDVRFDVALVDGHGQVSVLENAFCGWA